MDRFASIQPNGRRKKLNTDILCRCCGLEQTELYSIVGENPFNFDGVAFSEKYYKLLGIKVSSADKLPQNICMMCSDKINDFHEFRTMTYNTETQTREILGLAKLEPIDNIDEELKKSKNYENKIAFLERKLADLQKKLVLAQVQCKQNAAAAAATVAAAVPPVRLLASGAGLRKRGADQQVAIEKAEPPKKVKREFPCKLCSDRSFLTTQDLIEHLSSSHIPTIAKFGCASCHECFNMLADFKAHQKTHVKAAYKCFICPFKTKKLKEFSNHLRKCSESTNSTEKTVEDIKCFSCKKKFLTQNLFEWHACFIRTKGSCIKCGQYVPKKPALFKHYINCQLPFATPDFALDPIKKEATDEGDEVAASSSSVGRKKVAPAKRTSTTTQKNIVKSEVQIDDTSRDEAEPEEGEVMSYEPEINYDGFQNDDDSDEEIPPNQMEPVVKLEKVADPAVNIKQEKSSSQSAIQQKINAMIRSIKQEPAEADNHTQAPTTAAAAPLKLRIKGEKDEQASIKLLNPLAMKNKSSSSSTVESKKVFKITPALLAKIKKEKIDREEQRDEAEPEDEDLFGAPAILKIKQEKIDERDEAKGANEDLFGRALVARQHQQQQKNFDERDEAEAEDEDLLNGGGMATNATETDDASAAMRVKIKAEKMDLGYGDEVMPKKRPKKQLINPLALRNAQKVHEDATNDKSLVISSVTSINQNENNSSNNFATTDPIPPPLQVENNLAADAGAATVESSVEALQLNNNHVEAEETPFGFDEELDDLLRRCEKTSAEEPDGISFDDLLS